MVSSSFSSYFIGKDIQEGLNGFCLFNALQSCSCGSLFRENFWKEQNVQVCLKGAPEFSLPQSCGSKYKLLNRRSSFSSLNDPMSSSAEHC